MRALTIDPARPHSLRVDELEEPSPGPDRLLVDGIAVGVVRRPDPEPCAACARGESDMCRNGRYTERGIDAHEAFRPRDDDVKVIIDLEEGHA